MIKLKKNDILKDLSNEIFSSPNVSNENIEQPTESNVDNQVFNVENMNNIFVDTPKTEEKQVDNATIESQLNEFEKPIDMSMQQEVVNNEEVSPKEEINFDKINEMLDEAINDGNKQDEVSLNDINNIIENHFNDVETASEVSFNELDEKTVDSDLTETDALDEALMDYKDEDITFNDLNNMTQEINLEELNAVLEQIEDEHQEQIIEEKVEEVVVETKIESNFPKLDKFGSVFPRKNM